MNSLWCSIQQNIDALTQTIGLKSLALANEDGLVIAACGSTPEVEMMAAFSPLLRNGNSLPQPYRDALQRQGLGFSVFDFHQGGQSLFLCATGADSQIHHPALPQMLEQIAHQLIEV